ncbi:MAG TPA: hypothetical protein VN837_16630 [Chloroflexota bacterium]|nr:hypothetical protein [Chloroflexota bacterium]
MGRFLFKAEVMDLDLLTTVLPEQSHRGRAIRVGYSQAPSAVTTILIQAIDMIRGVHLPFLPLVSFAVPSPRCII